MKAARIAIANRAYRWNENSVDREPLLQLTN